MYIHLRHCREIEDLASKIYLKFSQNPAYAQEVREVFQKLSADERGHARHIDLVLQASNQEVDALPRVSGERLKGVKNRADELYRIACRNEMDEEKALQMAVQIEQEFMEVHIQNVLQFYNPKLAELFDKLNAEDQRHIDTLNKCLREWRSRVENKKSPGSK